MTDGPLTFGSLFTGIGGFDLGLERAGMRVHWQCENDPYCRAVLARRWPYVQCYPDVRWLIEASPVDVLCGGFPCQDISQANPTGVGIRGERSGLWSQMFRLTRELRPSYLLVENVPALLTRGLDVVLADLASIGFDAEWDCLRALDFGAPHVRERIWIVAYPQCEPSGPRPGEPRDVVRTPSSARGEGLQRERRRRSAGDRGSGRAGLADVADSNGPVGDDARCSGEALSRPGEVERPGRCSSGLGESWPTEPDVGRVAHGVPARVDRLRALGNSLVPQIAEWIGRRIVSYESAALEQQDSPRDVSGGVG